MTILGRSEELVSRCVECDLAEPESLASLGGSAPGVVDGILSYRDLVMSTEGISLNIVENAVSEELTKGDLKKSWERLERRWKPKTREDKVEVYTRFLNYKLENTRQKPMDWITFMEKKRAELMNTGHIMDD